MLKTLKPSWVEKMRFTSSNHAKTLLKYTDALPDGMVFDQKLQDQVMRRIIGQEDDEKKSSSGAVLAHFSNAMGYYFQLGRVEDGCQRMEFMNPKVR